jgi:hypothetical protein
MNKGSRRAAAAATAALALAAGLAAYATSSASASTSVVGPCGDGNIDAWVNVDSAHHAAGTTSYHLEFTNKSTVECFLWGFPGVTATTIGGRQLGAGAALNDAVKGKNVYLMPGETGHSVLDYVSSAVDPACKPEAASYLKVYQPGAFAANHAFFSLPVCTTSKPSDLTVEMFQPGI